MKAAVLLCALLVVQVASHGWMMQPVPRSGGGTGTGNAATTSPCGKTGPTTSVATYAGGDMVELGYARANAHGNTGYTVKFKMTFENAEAEPTQAQFDAGYLLTMGEADHQTCDTHGGAGTCAEMDVNINGMQTTMVQMPYQAGRAVIQFHWMPTSGGSWYDCAYVTMLPTGINASNNGCMPRNESGCVSADMGGICTPTISGDVICSCKVGYCGNGIDNCTMLEMPKMIELKVMIPTSEVSQNNFTILIAEYMNVDVGRVGYDKAVLTVEGYSVITFFVGTDCSTGDGGEVEALRKDVAENSINLDNLGKYVPASIRVVGMDDKAILKGAGLPEVIYTGTGATAGTAGGVQNPNGINAASVAAPAFGLLVAAAVLAL